MIGQISNSGFGFTILSWQPHRYPCKSSLLEYHIVEQKVLGSNNRSNHKPGSKFISEIVLAVCATSVLAEIITPRGGDVKPLNCFPLPSTRKTWMRRERTLWKRPGSKCCGHTFQGGENAGRWAIHYPSNKLFHLSSSLARRPAVHLSSEPLVAKESTSVMCPLARILACWRG